MPNDFKFDPVTRDLIPDGKGWFQTTPHADTMIQLQLSCHADECWQDDNLGSFLHDLKRFQAKPEILLPDEASRALKVLQARGRIQIIDINAVTVNPGRVDVATKSRDTSTGQVIGTLTKAGG